MRKFDYRHMPRGLFGGKVGDANVRVHQDKGRLDVLEQMHPELLEPLREVAHVDSVDASARIDGFYLDRSRVAQLVGGAVPQREVEAQIAGYSQALRMIERDADSLEFSTATILAFYETLFQHRDLGRKSRYRRKDYMHVQVGDHVETLPVSPITAFETPLVLGGACDSLAEAYDAEACSPLILAAVFTVDFLCIRPFDEGNGRISRLFADFLLAKAGVSISRYVSIDKVIEQHGMEYYDALNACVDGWGKERNDYAPFALFWLEAIHEAYQTLFDKADLLAQAGSSKSERVRLFVQNATSPVTKRQVLGTFPDISEATVENVLGKMVRDGEVRKIGMGRATSYQSLKS